MKIVRGLLICLGIAGIGIGLYGLYDYYPTELLVAIGKWLIIAVALHDGVLVPLTLGVGALLWWGTHKAPAAVGSIVAGGLIVAGVVSLIAAPAIWREGKSSNPTVLTQHYGHNLAWLLIGIGAATVLLAAAAWWRAGKSDNTTESKAENGSPVEFADDKQGKHSDVVRQKGEGGAP